MSVLLQLFRMASLELLNLSLQRRNGCNLLLLLRIWLKVALPHALVKLFVLVHLLAGVPKRLTFGVEEEIAELAEVELDRSTLLLLVLLPRGCRLRAHLSVWVCWLVIETSLVLADTLILLLNCFNRGDGRRAH